jgi:hypothetical protein
MKIHASDTRITEIGIEILRSKINDPRNSYKSLGLKFGLNENESLEAKASAEYHLGIKVHAVANSTRPFLKINEMPVPDVHFGDIPMMYLAPEPQWMEFIDFNQLEPTTDEKAVLYMSKHFNK